MPESSLLNTWFSQLVQIDYLPLLRIILMVIVGIPVVYISSGWIKRYVSKKYSAQYALIGSKGFFYVGIILLFISILNQLGFTLGPLLGATGIIGIAVGFASQTSVSNIISGLFLLAEQPFVINDVIKVGDITGEVLSIDIMSVKLRTFDNRFVRTPNETIIKNQVINMTRFPIRRVEIDVGVAYKEDIRKVREILFLVAHENPLVMEEPAPLIFFKGFGSSSQDFSLRVWAETGDYFELLNVLPEEIKREFDRGGIEIPFPHISLYSGEATKSFPVSYTEKAI